MVTRSGDYYDTMQVCLNGHKITEFAESQSVVRQEFCAKCGAKTILACTSCQKPIRGHRHMSRVFSSQGTPVPKYCMQCGVAHPWQQASIENLEAIMREGDLSQTDMETVVLALPDILQDTPKTELATLRLSKVMAKLGKPIYDVAIGVISDIASETAKKSMGLI